MKKLTVIFLALCFFSSCTHGKSECVFPYLHQGKYGLMNENHKIIVKAEYTRLDFYDNCKYFIGVDRDSKWVILNERGKCLFKDSNPITHIYDDFFAVMEKKGEALFSVKNADKRNHAYKFIRSSQALIPCKKENLFEYIDLNGQSVFQNQYFRRSYGFYEGVSVNMTKDWEWAVIDESGNYLFGKDFEYLGQKFSEGLLFAQDKFGKSGYVDSSGKFKILVKTSRFTEDNSVASHFYNGVAIVLTDADGFCLINRNGEYLKKNLPIMYFYDFCDGFALVITSKNSDKKILYNYIDTSGNFLSKENFEYAQNFCNGWAAVSIYGRDAVINKKGEIYF